MKNLIKTICACVLLLLWTPSFAQQIHFRHYSVIDGLGSNTVWNITQDGNGYMWFGTKNGLYRFDGYTFKTYKANKQDKDALGNNFIHAICRYDSKTYWIGTEEGVYVLDLETEKFSLLKGLGKNAVFDILKDSRGTIWIATRNNGLYRYLPSDKSFQQFRADDRNPNTVSMNMLRKLVEDTNGNIWIASFAGIDVLDPRDQTFRHYKAGKEPGSLSSNQVLTLYKDLEGNIWVGTLSGGLNKWSKHTNRFTTYKMGGAGTINDNIVRVVCQPSPDKLYVGTEKGLNVFDIATQTFTAYTNKSNDPFSISDNAVYAIYPDREGGIWVGTYFGGVNYFPGRGTPFELYYATGDKNALSGNAVSCFLEDKPGYFWIGTENAGLNYFNAHAKTFQHYPFAPGQQKLSYHNIHSLFKDRKGNIWIGTFTGGLNVFNPRTGAVKTYMHDPADSTSLSNNSVYHIYEDSDGGIWIGTVRGLNKYDPQKDAFVRVQDLSLDYNCIYRIYEDAERNIWVATYDNGLLGWERETNKWISYSATGKPGAISSNKVISLLDDKKGNLWLGTDGGGLNRFSLEDRSFTVFNEGKDISSIIFGILQDENGDLWLSTNEGLVRFSPDSQKSRLFTNWDNLQSKQFNYKAYLKASNGKFYFGGIHGFNAFLPENIQDSIHKSYIALTNFQLFNKDVSIDKDNSPLSKLIGFQKTIELSHNQNVLSFEYTALSFVAPEKIQYAYLMEGFDKSWNYVGTQRKATYTNLPPGTYTFKVKSTDNQGNWNEKTSDIKVVVRPPFYRTNFAYIIYVLLLAGGVIGFRNYNLKQVRRKNQAKLERETIQREKEFYNQKIEFFTTMAHEIRTPLSLIIAPLEKLMAEEKWKPEIKEQLVIMDENSDRLLNLVNQLLDFRRIESDIYTIRTEELELISFIHSVYSKFSAISYQKGIKFSMVTSVNRLDVSADPEALMKILNNLLINAFKFARNHVEIRIDGAQRDVQGKQFFSVSVVDDGQGIPANQIESIFKAFYKVHSSKNQYNNVGGTGIGLALAKSLAEKHNGKLLVESKEGVRTEFTLMIPYEVKDAVSLKGDEVLSAATEEPAEDKPVILVVEDDQSLLDFISKSLKTAGYNCLRAIHGKEAMKVLETNSVELIISDVMMPEMDGIELCKQVKGNINYSHIPVILLTARDNSDSQIAGIENGADAYITKPFKWKHVTVVIKNLLESRVLLKSKFTQQPFADVNTLSTNTNDKKFIEKLIGIIEDRITDPQLSVEELSKEMAMSRSSLHKKLKAMSGHVPNEFIRLIRLKNAAKLLLSGEHNISEVGYMTGFNSPSYFSKCFMQQFNMTPSEFVEKQTKDAVDARDITL